MRPRVSIIVPTHDRPHLLPRALASLEGQSSSDWQAIVVVNNPDAAVRRAYASLLSGYLADERFELALSPRAGLGLALNLGLAFARGEFVAVLEDDDEWDPPFLESLVGELDPFAGPLVYCDQRERLGDEPVNWVVPPPAERQDYSRLFGGNWIAFPMALVRRAELLVIGGFDESCGGATDWDTWLRLAARGPFRHARQTLVTHHWQKDRSNYCLDESAMARANARIAEKRRAGAYRYS